MSDFERESHLIPKIVQSDGQKRFYAEVPLFTKMVDLYAVGPVAETAAYELKLRDWKRAIRQAAIYLLAADYVYVAMPAATARRTVSHRTMFESLGIGLLAVDGSVEEVIAPRRSPYVSARHKRHILDFLARRDDKEVDLRAP